MRQTLCLLCLMIVIGLFGAPHAAWAAPVASSATAPATSSTSAGDGPVVLIGTTGLRWDEVSAQATPNIWRLTQTDASVGSLVDRSVRQTACPADGWLALSAGARVSETAPGGSADLSKPTGRDCQAISAVNIQDGAASVADWSNYRQAASDEGYDAQLGAFGDLMQSAGVQSAGIGSGAAIALATSSGQTAGSWAPMPSGTPAIENLVQTDLNAGTRLLVVDAGQVFAGDNLPPTAEQASEVDATIGAVWDAVIAAAPNANIVLASLADDGTGPHLQLLMGSGPRLDGNLLGSVSTHRNDLAQTTDLSRTLAELAGVPAEQMAGTGTAVQPWGTPGGDGSTRVGEQADQDRHDVQVNSMATMVVVGVTLIVLALVAATMLRLTRGRGPSWRQLRIATTWAGALPIASFLANALPWWRGPVPALTLSLAMIVIAAVLTVVAVRGPWGRHPLGPMAVVGAVTGLVLGLDVLTGSGLQLAAPVGPRPLVGGRFYGMSNTSLALFGTGLLAACAGLAAWRGRRAAWVCGAVGVVAAVIDGLPSLGADLAGPLALVPAFAVLTLVVAGIRLTWRRVVAVLASGVVLVAVFSFADYLRGPSKWTHLGEFVNQVLHGGFAQTIGRKLSANLTVLLYTLPIAAAFVAVAVVIWRSIRTVDAVRQLREQRPVRAGTVAMVLLLAIGMLTNDSGISLAGVGLAIVLPWWMSALAATAARKTDPNGTGIAALRPAA